MQLKQKTRYAIRILLCLAQQRGYLNAEALSQQACVPHNDVSRIVGKLRDAQIVESIGGCKGGCRLRQAPFFITLYDVMAAVDDLFQPETFQPEAMGEENICERENDVLATLQNELRTALRGITLDIFCDMPTAYSGCPAYQAFNAGLLSVPLSQRRELS